MHNPRHPHVLPVRDGVSPSCVVLPTHGQGSMLDFLAERLPAVPRDEWCQRMEAGDVIDERGQAVLPVRPFEGGLRLYYYRSLSAEPTLPFSETVVYQDEHLVVADKPHFMPVTPSGRYLHNTLLVRLKRRLGLPELSPLHRIDRDTAGLVMLSVHQATRGAYQALFRDRQIIKRYEAVAPWRADLVFPRDHRSRVEESPQFFRMQEAPGEPNSHTHMQVLETDGDWARYLLSPVTGKRHQLRVHMAALGLPLRNDAFYPVVNDPPDGDYSRPLQLLARSLEFVDPVTGEHRVFASRQSLHLP
ncbi:MULTISPECIES: pseudouridine synthase [unclassified Acidovorax]|uniref:pseudouridine synthase n=1 Tax=unclassified Acidovorax TaxID=2684926 RepID=UPI0006FCBB64|nr:MULTISPECIES: pseudouridine synthase [unclassified Acidovorax]KRB27791.1 pseudouridine synthase [Acidovorax sp. Root70]PUA96732.1 23S rRNA-/tRNA-specific pseudouridylate synthase [Acidovorax sp. 107]